MAIIVDQLLNHEIQSNSIKEKPKRIVKYLGKHTDLINTFVALIGLFIALWGVYFSISSANDSTEQFEESVARNNEIFRTQLESTAPLVYTDKSSFDDIDHLKDKTYYQLRLEIANGGLRIAKNVEITSYIYRPFDDEKFIFYHFPSNEIPFLAPNQRTTLFATNIDVKRITTIDINSFPNFYLTKAPFGQILRIQYTDPQLRSSLETIEYSFCECDTTRNQFLMASIHNEKRELVTELSKWLSSKNMENSWLPYISGFQGTFKKSKALKYRWDKHPPMKSIPRNTTWVKPS